MEIQKFGEFENVVTGFTAIQSFIEHVVSLTQKVGELEMQVSALLLQQTSPRQPNLRGIDSKTLTDQVINSVRTYMGKIGADYGNANQRGTVYTAIYEDFHQHTGIKLDRKSLLYGERLVDGYVRMGHGPSLKKFIDEYTGVVNVGVSRKTRKKPNSRQRRRSNGNAKLK